MRIVREVDRLDSFIRELLEKRPLVDEDRRRGRAIWWDKQPRDLALRREMDEGSLPQKGYVYQTEVGPNNK